MKSDNIFKIGFFILIGFIVFSGGNNLYANAVETAKEAGIKAQQIHQRKIIRENELAERMAYEAQALKDAETNIIVLVPKRIFRWITR